MKITSRYLIVPVNPQAKVKKVLFYDKTGGKLIFSFDANLDFLSPAQVMYYDMERFRGMEFDLFSEPEMSLSFEMSEIRPMDGVYDSYLRPAIHFTAARGWINDPNGLVYHNGVYHMFFQHNPLGTAWGNMHWGHAISHDLLHWKEEDIALFTDHMGTMFSGSGFIDKTNATGLSPDGNTMLLFYSAAGSRNRESQGRLFSQCLAYSTDGGKTVIKHGAFPNLSDMHGNDPKVVWCEELSCYLMVIYAGGCDYRFFESTDLLSWKDFQTITVHETKECPDLYLLTADNGEKKWIFTNAGEVYLVGHMDTEARCFVPDQEAKKGRFGTHGYAAQTFANLDGRCVKVEWNQFTAEGTLFGGQMNIPTEISLVCRDGEYFQKATPIRELDSLVTKTETVTKRAVLSQTASLDITICAEKDSEDFTVSLFGCTFDIKPKENRFIFGEKEIPLSLTGETCEIRMITDTLSVECFLDGGLVSASFGTVLDKNLNTLTVTCPNAEQIVNVTVKTLESIFPSKNN